MMSMILVACGDEDHFRVKGTVDGNATLNIRVGYEASGAYQSLLTAARDGVFEFQGSAPEGTLVDLYDHDYRLIGRFYGQNGTDYNIEIIRGKPFAMKVQADGKGADLANRFSAFLNANADSLSFSPNEPISRYIKSNPDDLVSTLLLTTLYDAYNNPVEADSLLNTISPQARPSLLTAGFQDLLRRVLDAYPVPDTLDYRTKVGGRDTLFLHRQPLTLFLADTRHSDRKRLVAFMKKIRKEFPESKLKMVELSLDNDTTEWKREIANDSATWIQTWTPGSVSGPLAEHLAIEQIPHFVVVDSAGWVQYRGSAENSAQQSIRNYLKK